MGKLIKKSVTAQQLPPQKKRGAALITALVVVFIVMAIITNITVRNYRVIRRLTNQKVMEQCYGILLVAVDFGRAALATSATTSKTDALTDIWAQPIPRTKLMDDIFMSGYLIDEQGKFNLNDLIGAGQVNLTVLAQFSALLKTLNIPEEIAPAIAYYMAAPQYQGSITQGYLNGNPAYRPAGKPLVDLSELILVKGMNPQWVYKLNQYVTAIPQPINGLIQNESQSESGVSSNPKGAAPTGTGSVLVNVNTASAQVIAAKSGIPLAVAQRMTTVRENTPFKSQQDITNFLTSNGIMLSQNSSQGTTKITPSTLTTNSNYFTVHVVVDKGDYEFKWVALLYRASRGGQWPKVLWQHPE
ncbi:MAG: Type secretion system protein [Pseudomonadota bacterium]|nr:Type secretion system protein [Pseudomonadota bacterium]